MYIQTLSWRSRYFIGERPSQPAMMWWTVCFSTRQICYASSSSTLKTCFSIYLVEIACSWVAAIDDSVDLFRVKDFSHWLDRSLRTYYWSRYLANCPCIFFFFEFRLQFVDTCGFDGDFQWQFPYGSQLLNIKASFITILLCLLVDRFSSSGYLPV